MNTYAPAASAPEIWRMYFSMDLTRTRLTRPVSPTPFVPEDDADRAERCNEILCIAALGLKKRLEHTHAKTAVVGLSGGLDSTLAVLITAVAMEMLDRPRPATSSPSPCPASAPPTAPSPTRCCWPSGWAAPCGPSTSAGR